MKKATLLISIPLLGTVASAQLLTPYARNFRPVDNAGYFFASVKQDGSELSWMVQEFNSAPGFRLTNLRMRGAVVPLNSPPRQLIQNVGWVVSLIGSVNNQPDYSRQVWWVIPAQNATQTFLGAGNGDWNGYDITLNIPVTLAPSGNTTGNINGTLPGGRMYLAVQETRINNATGAFALQLQSTGQSSFQLFSGGQNSNLPDTSMVIQGVPEPLTVATVSIGLIGLARRRKRI